MEGFFSKRLKNALSNGTLPYPSFAPTVRRRLAMACLSFNEERPGWGNNTDDRVLGALQEAYGQAQLRVQATESSGDREAKDLEDFFVYAYPQSVLDALEAFYRLLSDGQQDLQRRVNDILEEEGSPWRMSDGRMYLVDSRFLDALKDEVEQALKSEGFLGAHEELQEARGHLQVGQSDDAIQKSNRAFESALKSLLNVREGTAESLLKKMRSETALLDGVPDDAQRAIVSKVLQGLPVLRHKIAGHGQGPQPIDVPRAYGDFAINLAASYIKLLLDLKRELTPATATEPEAGPDEDDGIPF